jgi:hypothetical protein
MEYQFLLSDGMYAAILGFTITAISTISILFILENQKNNKYKDW